MKYVRALIASTYIIVDVIILCLAFFLPYFMYYHHPHYLLLVQSKMHLLVYAFWMVMTILLFYSSQLYFTVRELTIWREAKRVIRAFLFSTLLTTLLLFFLKVQTLSRLVLGANIGCALFALVFWRIVKRFFVQYLVSRGFNNWNVLVIGAGRIGKKFVDSIERRPQLGFRVVGFLDDHIPAGTLVKNHLVLGKISDFESVVRRNFIGQAFITIPSERNIVSRIGFRAKHLGVAMQVVADDFGLELGDLRLYEIDSMPILEYHSPPPNYHMIIVKRAMDILISTVGLILTVPLFMIIGIVIKLDSCGPVFYASRRWGKKGYLFSCYKFRSMVQNADELRVQLESNNEMDGPVFKIKNDPRLTKVGKWLRKYSLDELPQLWNVLKGDMSLVGPRPLPEREKVGDLKLEYLQRLSIKPGLTCLWQIRGRNHIPFKRWMKLDEYYIRNWSPGMDFAILFRTIPAVLKGKGAY